MKAARPMVNDHSGEWHKDSFIRFMAAKAAVGEPSPHMKTVVAMAEGRDLAERLWMVGAYAVPYSVLTAQAIWSRFPRPSEGMGEWVQVNWPGVHTRLERKAVRIPANFARCLNSMAAWLESEPARLLRTRYNTGQERYEAWWNSAIGIYGFGRYITIRFLEAIRLTAGVPLELQDLRAIDPSAWSPIRGLALLYPEHQAQLLSGDLVLADHLGERWYREIMERLPGAGRYATAAILCEYRKAYEDRNEYPGRTLDQELEYANGRYAAYWQERGHAFREELYAVRHAIFPEQALGEWNGWLGVRSDCAAMLRDQGIVWSDLAMDYAELA